MRGVQAGRKLFRALFIASFGMLSACNLFDGTDGNPFAGGFPTVRSTHTPTPSPDDRADHLVYVAGNLQTATVATQLPLSLTVRVADVNGLSVPGVSIRIRVLTNNGSSSAATVLSDSNGLVSVTFTLGTVAGVNTVIFDRSPTALPDEAGSGNPSYTFTETGVAGPADYVTLTAGSGQSAATNANLAVNPVVTLTDRYGNAVSGTVLTIHPLQGDPKPSVTQATTNASGQITFSVRLGALQRTQRLRIGRKDTVLPDLAGTGRATLDLSATVTQTGAGKFYSQKIGSWVNSALAVGDVNNDTFEDIVAPYGSSSDQVAVHLSNGDGTFQAPVVYATGNLPIEALLVDLNGDTFKDLVVSNFGDNDISVYLNDGNGLFPVRNDYSTPAGPRYLAAADLDGDFDIDVVSQCVTGLQLRAHLNDGFGDFTNRVDSGVVDELAIALGDVDGDLFPDVVAAYNNGAMSSLEVYINNQSAGFASVGGSTPVGDTATGIVLGLFDGDANLDVVLSLTGDDQLAFLAGDGGGNFGGQVNSGSANGPQQISAADFNGDGNLDILSSDDDDTLQLHLGAGNGSFGAPTAFENVTNATRHAIGDFNGDGWKDFAGSGLPYLNGYLAQGAFKKRFDYATATTPNGILSLDVNADGDLDLIVSNSGSNSISVFPNGGTGVFGAKADYATAAGPYGMVYGDYDGDGVWDLAVATATTSKISVLLGIAGGTFAAKTDYDAGSTPYAIAQADFNRDGHLDLVTANSGAGTVSVLLGAGDGTFGAKTDYNVGTQPNGVVTGDFNEDGRPDIAATSTNTNTVHVLLGASAGGFAASVSYATGNEPKGLLVGDFDSDGHLDLVSFNETGNSASFLAGVGDGTFAAKIDQAGISKPSRGVVADLDGDGDLDFAVGATTVGGEMKVRFGANDGSFASGILFQSVPVSSVAQVTAGDFNGDGKIDLACTAPEDGKVSVVFSH